MPVATNERRRSRAAECGQQFPPSDGECHTPLPCEVRKGTIPHHERAVLTARHPARAGRTPGTGCNGATPSLRVRPDFKRFIFGAPLQFLSELRDDVGARAFSEGERGPPNNGKPTSG